MNTQESNNVIDNTVTGLRTKSRTIVHKHDKVHRNDMCKCGSGRKYKKCCLQYQQ
jgi:uncharacterized protein YecA (UPF0149 family)